MSKKYLSIAALCFMIASQPISAQNTSTSETIADSSEYKSRKLKKEEVNFVTGYFQQNGNNASVTGGEGDEFLTDVATTINMSLAKYDKKFRKHSIGLELGVDVYTSASSDQIDPTTVSSASSGDVRLYPSVNYTVRDDSSRYILGGGLSASYEFDYTSLGGNLIYSKWSKDNNREITLKGSVFFDEWKVILPLELRPVGYGSGAEDDPLSVDYEARNSYNFGMIYTQVINKKFQMALLGDIAYQEGLLSTRFHRVYFNDGSLRSENLPTTKLKIPVGVRTSYFIGDRTVMRGYYRYYWDNWGVQAHTASLEFSYKITPFISLAPSYRFYTQQATDYFAAFQGHDPTQTYFTSDYDLSGFNSNMFSLNARFSNLNDKIFMKKLNAIELRYGYYMRSTNLDAHTITLALNFK